jgi:hypothetical protein
MHIVTICFLSNLKMNAKKAPKAKPIQAFKKKFFK